ncbi:MAG: ABC transporter ATP-binding protein [Myxococcaceae bacterium]|nr:ABC transporter ATP-binding protein [Myxococcaceae bacterium]
MSKTYRLGFFLNKNVLALQGLELVIEPGQIFGLLGPNGAGKSTTIKILMNLVRPSSGTVRIFGTEAAKREARSQVGFLPENPMPYEYLSGEEFVRLAGKLLGLSGQALDTRVKEVIGAVEMSNAAKLQVRRYSKGMVQRIALAQALINKPRLLILDEPTSGLDPLGRRLMRDIILEQRSQGTTVLFCTHIISDAETLCDRLAVLVAGKKVQEGKVSELLSSQVPVLEVAVEGLSKEQLSSVGVNHELKQEISERLWVRVTDQDLQAFIGATQRLQGRVTRIQPIRFTLEDLFMNALQQAETKVGGTFS